MKFILNVLLIGFLFTSLNYAKASSNNDRSDNSLSPTLSRGSLSPALSKGEGEEKTLSIDSVKSKIEIKVSIYEKQLSINKESITQLEMELEERKKLNERLNAAILVSREILNELLPQGSK